MHVLVILFASFIIVFCTSPFLSTTSVIFCSSATSTLAEVCEHVLSVCFLTLSNLVQPPCLSLPSLFLKVLSQQFPSLPRTADSKSLRLAVGFSCTQLLSENIKIYTTMLSSHNCKQILRVPREESLKGAILHHLIFWGEERERGSFSISLGLYSTFSHWFTALLQIHFPSPVITGFCSGHHIKLCWRSWMVSHTRQSSRTNCQ